MKKLFFVAAAFVAGFTAMAQQKPDDVIKFNTEKYDFGKVKQGVPVTTDFTLTNISDKPVVVVSASNPCGCTPTKAPTEPIPVGGAAKLNAGFNAANPGHFERHVTVTLAGITATKDLIITGDVVDAATYDASVKAEPVKPTPAVVTDVKAKTKVKATKKNS